jgi:uncharacterized membrane protein YdjX (TVP38/TMEM64 family)
VQLHFSLRTYLLTAMAVVLGLLVLGWSLGLHQVEMTGEAIENWIDVTGPWGALLIIGLMATAVVASPLPSAPIAVAAGTVYGHIFGTALVVVGAETGAIVAFLIARKLGRKALRRRFGDQLNMGLLGSQNALMLVVFASRLVPFVSFDLMSYAAGLTKLRLWRFSVATLAGILPASFVLAHLGGELASSSPVPAIFPVLGLGLITGLPILWVVGKRHRQNGKGGLAVEPDQGNPAKTG